MSTPSLTHTYFGSTLVAGDALTEATNGGYAVLSQVVTMTSVAGASASTPYNGTITLPAGAQIINFQVDVLTAPSGTVASAPLTIGTASAGTQYLSSTAAMTGGRLALTFTAAQVTAMSNIGTNTTLVATVIPNVAPTSTQGVWQVTVVYSMK